MLCSSSGCEALSCGCGALAGPVGTQDGDCAQDMAGVQAHGLMQGWEST
jgi:hypothetical protein